MLLHVKSKAEISMSCLSSSLQRTTDPRPDCGSQLNEEPRQTLVVSDRNPEVLQRLPITTLCNRFCPYESPRWYERNQFENIEVVKNIFPSSAHGSAPTGNESPRISSTSASNFEHLPAFASIPLCRYWMMSTAEFHVIGSTDSTSDTWRGVSLLITGTHNRQTLRARLPQIEAR